MLKKRNLKGTIGAILAGIMILSGCSGRSSVSSTSPSENAKQSNNQDAENDSSKTFTKTEKK